MTNRKRIILAGALGLLTTVGIAWTAMFIPYGPHGYGPPTTADLGLVKTTDETRIYRLSEGKNAWHRVISYWHMQISGLSLMIPIEDYEQQKTDLDLLPNHLRPGSVDELNMQAWYREVGFPLPALTCSIHWNTQIRNADIMYDVHGGVQLPRDTNFTPRALPLVPVWPGFVIDLLVYSFVFWLVIWFGSALRGISRSRRGLCPTCGYSRTGLANDARCPECGHAPDH